MVRLRRERRQNTKHGCCRTRPPSSTNRCTARQGATSSRVQFSPADPNFRSDGLPCGGDARDAYRRDRMSAQRQCRHCSRVVQRRNLYDCAQRRKAFVPPPSPAMSTNSANEGCCAFTAVSVPSPFATARAVVRGLPAKSLCSR